MVDLNSKHVKERSMTDTICTPFCSPVHSRIFTLQINDCGFLNNFTMCINTYLNVFVRL